MPSPISQRATGAALVLGLTWLLGGCASVYQVDSQVQSFANWGSAAVWPAPPQLYRFERLPSQNEASAALAQDALEALTGQALAPLGWQPASTSTEATWTVQVRGETQQLPRAPWEDPWERFGLGWGLSSGHGPWRSGLMLRQEWPYFERQVVLVVRQANSGRVVYETRARHDGRWSSSPALWRAMLDAALRDFPQPPSGVRRVDIDVPR